MEITAARQTAYAALFIACAGLLLTLCNPAWIYSPPNYVDGWCYVGHYTRMAAMRRAFPTHPSGDLLSIILPAAALYKLFPPLLANLLFKLGTWLAAVFIFFLLARRETTLRSAICATGSLGLYKYMMIAAGTDYTDGKALLYFMASLYAVSRALDGESGKTRWLCAAGAFYQCYVSTAFLGLVYMPLALLFYLGKCSYCGQKAKLRDAGAFLLGFITAALALCCIHLSYTGHFIYFENTVRKALAFLSAHRAGTASQLHWLVLPLYLMAFAAARILLKFHAGETARQVLLSRETVLQSLSAAGFCLALFLQCSRHQETVTNARYFTHLIPVIFIALAATLEPLLEELTESAFHKTIFILTGLLFASFLFDSWLRPPQNSMLTALLSPWCLAAWLAAGMFLLSRKRYGLMLLFMLALVCVCNFSPKDSEFLYYKQGLPLTGAITSRREAFTAALGWLAVADRLDPQREKFLWYNASSELYLKDWAAASHLWQGRVYNEAFPESNAPIGEMGVIPPQAMSGKRLLVLTPEPKQIASAQKDFAANGLALDCAKAADYTLPRISFTILDCAVTPAKK